MVYFFLVLLSRPFHALAFDAQPFEPRYDPFPKPHPVLILVSIEIDVAVVALTVDIVLVEIEDHATHGSFDEVAAMSP